MRIRRSIGKCAASTAYTAAHFDYFAVGHDIHPRNTVAAGGVRKMLNGMIPAGHQDGFVAEVKVLLYFHVLFNR